MVEESCIGRVLLWSRSVERSSGMPWEEFLHSFRALFHRVFTDGAHARGVRDLV